MICCICFALPDDHVFKQGTFGLKIAGYGSSLGNFQSRNPMIGRNPRAPLKSDVATFDNIDSDYNHDRSSDYGCGILPTDCGW